MSPKRNENKNYGLKNWLAIFLICFVLMNILDNYKTYGIIGNPIQIAVDLREIIHEGWYIIAILFLVNIIQTFHCVIIEKCLISGLISENKGRVLHLLNVFLLYNVFAYFCLYHKLNPLVGFILGTHIFVPTIKLFSYQLNNRRIRLQNRLKSGNGDEMTYPEKVTLRHVFKCMFCSGCLLYRLNTWKKEKRDYKIFFIFVVYSIALMYTCVFIWYQFVLPELKNTTYYIYKKQYLQLACTCLKLALPIHVQWLIFFYMYLIQTYVKLPTFLWGSNETSLTKDWWNSSNVADYWSTWNYQFHLIVKEEIFIPAKEMGYSKHQAAFFVSVISGVIHEYMWTIPFRIGYGSAILIMVAQIPLSSVTKYVSERFGKQWGNVLVWLELILGHTFGVILLYNFTQ